MSEDKKNPPRISSEISYVTLVEDPFGIRISEVAESQERDLEQDANEALTEAAEAIEGLAEELSEEISDEFSVRDLAQESAESSQKNSETQLESLARAMADEVARQESAPEVLEEAALAAVELAERLAGEIAEDQALARELAADAQEEGAAEAAPESGEAEPLRVVDQVELESWLETLLFLTDKAISVAKLKEMVGADLPAGLMENAVAALVSRYQAPHHGIELAEVAGGLQFRTKPGKADLARKLAKVQTQRLSRGAMESLAIIAYRQPLLKDDIDKIRGVDSSYFIRTLLDRKLIEISGRSELPGRPILYSTTPHFLEVFGLKDLTSLPSLREVEQMVPTSQGGQSDGQEDPRIREMRRLVGQMTSDTATTLAYDPREDEKILSEIRSRVQQIPTSTPFLEEQKALEKAASEQAAAGANTIEIPAELQGLAPLPTLEATPPPPAPSAS